VHLVGLRADRACSVATATLHAACCTMLCYAVRCCNRRHYTRRYASVIELFPYKVNRPLFANIIDKVPRTAMQPHKRATSIMQLINAFFRFELSSQSTLRLWSRPRNSIPNRTKRTKSGTTSGKTGTSTRPHQRFRLPGVLQYPSTFRVRLSLTTGRISPTAAAYTPGWSMIRSVVVR
jgi:hypothetical protein